MAKKRNRFLYRFLGGVLGSLLGFVVPVFFILLMADGRMHGLVLLVTGVQGVALGAVVGFFIGNNLYNKKLKRKKTELSKRKKYKLFGALIGFFSAFLIIISLFFFFNKENEIDIVVISFGSFILIVFSVIVGIEIGSNRYKKLKIR